MRKNWRWMPSLIHNMINILLSCHSHLILKYNTVNIMSSKKTKTVSNEVALREDRKHTHRSLLIVAKDATIPATSALPASMIDNILPFLLPWDLFIFMTTIKISQKSVTHELVVKAVINYFRQITTEHTDYVTTMNSLNTISYICAIIRTIHVPTRMRPLHLVNGRTC